MIGAFTYLHCSASNPHVEHLFTSLHDHLFTGNSLLVLFFHLLLVSQPLDDGDEDDLDKWDALSENQPHFDQLDLSCHPNPIHNIVHQVGESEHHSQVGCNSWGEEVGQPEKRCCIAEADKEEGREKCSQGFC